MIIPEIEMEIGWSNEMQMGSINIGLYSNVLEIL